MLSNKTLYSLLYFLRFHSKHDYMLSLRVRERKKRNWPFYPVDFSIKYCSISCHYSFFKFVWGCAPIQEFGCYSGILKFVLENLSKHLFLEELPKAVFLNIFVLGLNDQLLQSSNAALAPTHELIVVLAIWYFRVECGSHNMEDIRKICQSSWYGGGI